jgi:hypothetical protein
VFITPADVDKLKETLQKISQIIIENGVSYGVVINKVD